MKADSRTLYNFSPKERVDYEATTLRLVFAAHIENYLSHAGLQAKDLASRIGKSRAWISKLLSGRQNATLDTLAEVAWALGASWQVSLVASSKEGTPAQNDPVAPEWALRGHGQTNQRPILFEEGLLTSFIARRSISVVLPNEIRASAFFSARTIDYYWRVSPVAQDSEPEISKQKILLGSGNVGAATE